VLVRIYRAVAWQRVDRICYKTLRIIPIYDGVKSVTGKDTRRHLKRWNVNDKVPSSKEAFALQAMRNRFTVCTGKNFLAEKLELLIVEEATQILGFALLCGLQPLFSTLSFSCVVSLYLSFQTTSLLLLVGLEYTTEEQFTPI
jgi:hypothetical protein